MLSTPERTVNALFEFTSAVGGKQLRRAGAMWCHAFVLESML
jgi:hypothetical protein